MDTKSRSSGPIRIERHLQWHIWTTHLLYSFLCKKQANNNYTTSLKYKNNYTGWFVKIVETIVYRISWIIMHAYLDPCFEFGLLGKWIYTSPSLIPLMVGPWFLASPLTKYIRSEFLLNFWWLPSTLFCMR